MVGLVGLSYPTVKAQASVGGMWRFWEDAINKCLTVSKGTANVNGLKFQQAQAHVDRLKV